MATLNHAAFADDDAANIGNDKPRATSWARRNRAPRRVGRPGVGAHAGSVMLLTATTTGAFSLAVLLAGEPPAAATASTSSVARTTSVADALGVDAATPAEQRTVLEQLTASRAQREAEQAAAADAQARAEEAAAAARAQAEAQAAADAAAAAEAARAAASGPADAEAVMPIDGARLTSPFGPRWGTLHGGVDLAAPMLTPEYAAMDGIVLQAGAASGFGLAVYIQHANGDVTVYGHMEQILVEAGQLVQAGETIALVGNRGQSTGPHLHFEVRIGGMSGAPVDPLGYLRERGVAV